ncbi:MAG: hypothetical protein Kow00109_09460 [Acidobacteriota bacterium]
MSIQGLFLTSRLGRKMFFLFLLCGLAPMLVLGFLTWRQVSADLYDRIATELMQSCEDQAVFLIERLNLLEMYLEAVSGGGDAASPAPYPEIAVLSTGANAITLAHQLGRLLEAAELEHLAGGRSLLVADGATQVDGLYLVRAVSNEEAPRFAVLRVEPAFLLTDSNHVAGEAKPVLLVVTGNGATMTREGGPPSANWPVGKLRTLRGIGSLEFNAGNQRRLAAFRQVPLRFRFGCADWTVVVSADMTAVTAPIGYFATRFWLLVALTLVIALLLSSSLIRSSLGPLQALTAGVGAIQKGELTARVAVTTRDEFGDLARAFNRMAADLENQFHTLQAVSDMTGAVLSRLEPQQILTAFLHQLPRLVSSRSCSVLFVLAPQTAWLALWTESTRIALHRLMLDRDIDLAPAEAMKLWENGPTGRLAELVGPLFQDRSCLVVRLGTGEDFLGVLLLADPAPADEERTRVTKLADHLGAALSNARLLDQLKRWNLGAMTALARAVDAKSPWTAGHSERVARVAERIGRALGMEESAIWALRAGGLLHDLGKLGVSAEILDKAGPLEPLELAEIRNHPTIGARILEPLEAFESILPIVRYHHERFDGKGYPAGLRGEEIPLAARIVTVADALDAMLSDRPYRQGLELDEIPAILQEEAGKQFDPSVVELTVRLLREGAFPDYLAQDSANGPTAGEKGCGPRRRWEVGVPRDSGGKTAPRQSRGQA